MLGNFPGQTAVKGKVQSEDVQDLPVSKMQGLCDYDQIVQETMVLHEGKEELLTYFRKMVLLWKEELGNELNSIN